MRTLNKTLYNVLCLMIGVCMLSGCIEEFEADIPVEESDLLVVEGTICSGKMNKFVLSRSQPLQKSEEYWLMNGVIDGGWPGMYQGFAPLIYDATVSVRGSDGSEYKTTSTRGNYTCWIDQLKPDVEYYLHIEVDGEVYESEPQKPLPTEKIADVQGVQETPESNIDVLITPDVPFEAERANYYSWTYDETWEVHPDYTTIYYYDTVLKAPVKKRGQFPERGWKDAVGAGVTIGGSTSYEGQRIRQLKLYDLDRGDMRMYYRYSGLVHQRAISKAEYEYELARRQASEEMGGLFTPQPSALPTNIRCLTSRKRVIGYVGCSLNTSEYRFFLNAKDFTIYRPRRSDARRWLTEPTEDQCVQMVYSGFYLCDWQSPMISPSGKIETAWALLFQLDVRCNGAYIEEPDFWSLEENVSY